MHYSISLFVFTEGGGVHCMKKVVVTKGIFPPQPLHHSRKKRKEKNIL